MAKGARVRRRGTAREEIVGRPKASLARASEPCILVARRGPAEGEARDHVAHGRVEDDVVRLSKWVARA